MPELMVVCPIQWSYVWVNGRMCESIVLCVSQWSSVEINGRMCEGVAVCGSQWSYVCLVCDSVVICLSPMVVCMSPWSHVSSSLATTYTGAPVSWGCVSPCRLGVVYPAVCDVSSRLTSFLSWLLSWTAASFCLPHSPERGLIAFTFQLYYSFLYSGRQPQDHVADRTRFLSVGK